MDRFKQQCVLGLLAGVLVSCGGSASTITPGLPGDGTRNLDLAATTQAVTSDAPVDLWEGRDLIVAPAAKQPSALALPEVMHFTLKNGLQVIAVQDASLPITTLQIAFKTGSRESQPKKFGIADFTAQAMARGTKLRTAARIAKEIETVGGSLQASASYEATLFSCKSLSKDMKTCLSVLPDILANPKFPETELELIRRNLHASVRQRLDDAGQLASAHFKSALWGDAHPRGWGMSDATIDAIGRDDMVAWHKRWMVPNNAVLAVAGNFDAAKIRKDLERSFGRWRKGNVPARKEVKAEPLQGMRIRLVDKPGQTQSHIRLGHHGLAHSDGDFYPAMVFNYSLGGGQFSSRLMKVVRSAEGKAYTASSRFDRNRDLGAFVASTFTRSAETVATVKLMMQVLKSMGETGPTEEELQAAITNIAGSYATRFETAGDVASALLAADLHDFNDQYVSLFPMNVAKVTLAQAAAAAARMLDPVNMVLVIAGDAKVVGPQLKAAGWSFETVPHTEAVSNWERKAKVAAPATNNPAAVTAAIKLLDEALAVKGGAKRLRKIKSFHWVGNAALKLPTGPMKAKVEKQYASPDKLRLDMEIGGGQIKIATVLHGVTGWAQEVGPGGKQEREFTAPELAALSNQLWRDAELVLLRHTETGATVRSFGTRNLKGIQVDVISVSGEAGKQQVTLLIDSKSKLLLGLEYVDQGGKTSERYGDYKKVAGLQVAHTRSTIGAQVNMELKIDSFRFDTAISESVFLRPVATEK